MHVSRPDLNLFVVFEAIYSEGGVTRASERLNLTQPAVSHALARLRDLLGDPLFERRGRGLIPTPLARSMIGPVRDSLRSLEAVVTRAGAFEPGRADRRFVLGMRDLLESVLLPPLAAQIAADAPGVDLVSARIDRRRLEAELESGTLDAALDIFLPLSDRVRRAQVDRDGLVVVARQDHPALRAGLDLDTFLAQPHVLVTARRHGLGAEDLALRGRNLRRRIALRSQHYFAACRTAERSDLLLTMTSRLARLLAPHFRIRILPFPLELPQIALYLYWHESVEEDPANRWLRERIALAAGG